MGFRLANVGGRSALVHDEQWYDLARVTGEERLADPMAAVGDLPGLHRAAGDLASVSPDGDLAAAALGPPVPRPGHVFGLGLNYRTHAEESGLEPPPAPLVFTKFPGCLVGPTADVVLGAEAVDHEVELVVVIGPGGRDIPAERAWEHVAGVMAGQDISDRVLQFASAPPHFDLGKSRDTYGPVGPVLVSPDLLEDPDDLALSCDLNGERVQEDRTSGLIFDVPTLIAYLSGVLTLRPGDLVFTGTPAGVGMATGRFLRPGDELITTIEGVGRLHNRCV